MIPLGRVGGLLSALALLGAPAAPDVVAAPVARGGRWVYLDFADGTRGLTRGDDDDATRNVSRLCEVPSFARWEPAPACGPRDRCREEILRRVRRYFEAYDVHFTLSRPSPPQVFTTVVIAPPLLACTFGRRGVAFADCGDRNAANVALVFDCYESAAACAVLVAHEAAHTFGLVHSTDPDDIMTPGPEEEALRFRAEWAEAGENECGVPRQSSDAALRTVLGPASVDQGR